MKADQYGISIKQFYRDFSLQEINELQALDNMKDEKYMDKVKSKTMTDEERNKAIDRMFRGM